MKARAKSGSKVLSDWNCRLRTPGRYHWSSATGLPGWRSSVCLSLLETNATNQSGISLTRVSDTGMTCPLR